MLEELKDEFHQTSGRNCRTFSTDILEHVTVCSINNQNPKTFSNNGDTIHSFVVKFPVTQKLSNEIDIIHGGAIATALDVFTSVLLYFASNKKLCVSIDLHVSYISAAPKNSIVYCEARVDKVGRSLQFASCTFWTERPKAASELDTSNNNNKSPKILVATGRHTMFAVHDNSRNLHQLQQQKQQKQQQSDHRQQQQQHLSKL